MSEPRHARLLLAILRGQRDEAVALGHDQGTVGGSAFEPATFVRLCRQCEVHPWVHSLLDSRRSDLGWELVGDEVHTALNDARRKVRHDNMLLLARLEQSLDLLKAADVVPIALKGSDTLHRFYNGLDERALDDVDLLVRREDLHRALDALESAGWVAPPEPKRTHYIRSSHHLPLTSPGPITVDFELHWNIAQERRYSIDVEGMFSRAQPTDVAGRSVQRLEDHDAAAHLLIHHFSHYLGRGLKGVVDLQQIVARPGFSWAKVAERIRAWDGVAAAGISLVHLKKMWPELIDATAMKAMPVPLWRQIVLSPLRSSHPLELYRHTSNRRMQLLLAGMMLERIRSLPSWLLHRARRDHHAGSNPLDPSTPSDDGHTAATGK
jgi:hypothetical protein